MDDEPTTRAATDVDVLIVGAGLSGIGAACQLRRESPDRTFAVLESRSASGGTWDLFRYPGVRSDSDMFTLGYGFRPWDQTKAVAEGSAIRAYIRDTAREYGIDDHIRYRHRVVAAEWNSDTARWTVTAQLTDGSDTAARENPELVTIRCAFLFACAGYYTYDAGYSPDLPGIGDFAGTVVHPQHWPEDLEVDDRRVVVVGSGATAVTLVPALAARGAAVTMLQRSPTYVARIPSTDPWVEKLTGRVPRRWAHRIVRWKHIAISMLAYQLARRRPAKVRAAIKGAAGHQLPQGFDVDRHFTPRYEPWDQRLCFVPDGDFFKSIRAGKADVVTDTIDHFDASGVVLGSGERLDADVVITATGLTLQAIGGVTLTVDGAQVVASRTPAYKGMMLSGVPNFALTIGYTNASWTLRADLIAFYVCRVLNHLRDRGYDTVTPRAGRELLAQAENGQLRPLIDLNSGYVRRGIDKLPKQGTRAPWTLPQNYLRDLRLLRHSSIDDDVVFSHSPGVDKPGVSTIEVDGRAIRYRVSGSGEPMVLLHGIGRSLDDWDEQHTLLTEQYRVVSLDLPGFGWSDPLRSRASLQGMSDAVLAFLDALGIDEPVHLVGNSLGGAVAMQVAVDRPQRVADLVLVDAAGFGSEVATALRILGIRPLGRYLMRPSRSAAIDTLKGCFRDRSFITPERIESTLALACRPHGATTMLQLLRELGTVRGIRPAWRRELLTRLAPLRIPTLVIWGEKDLILPASHLDAARGVLPHSTFRLFPETGHFPQIERADEFAAAVSDFLTAQRTLVASQEPS